MESFQLPFVLLMNRNKLQFLRKYLHLQVTLVTSYKAPKPRKNVREIVISMDIHHLLPNVFTKSKTVGLTTFMVTAPELCSEALAKEEVQELLEEEFDVALVSAAFSHCFLSIAHQLKVGSGSLCYLRVMYHLCRMKHINKRTQHTPDFSSKIDIVCCTR